MQAIRHRLVNAFALVLAAAALACGGDAPSQPLDEGGKQNNGQSNGQTRTDTLATAVTITPNALAIRVGASGVLTAALVNASGAVLQVGSGALPWASSDTTVAKVSSAGVVTAIKVGQATVTTTMSGLSGTAQVAVLP